MICRDVSGWYVRQARRVGVIMQSSAVDISKCPGSELMEVFLGAELVSLHSLALTREELLLLSHSLKPHGLLRVSVLNYLKCVVSFLYRRI